ncbi:hypothetical protein IKA15_05410 [bacterium]|nr:hypothetical protein [bacterium]
MGMSASQTRVLMLTARQNDLEYQAQQILQAKLAASRQAEDAAAAYEEKISNTHFITKRHEGDELVQYNVTYDQVAQNGFYLVNRDGKIVLPSSTLSEDMRENPKAYGVEYIDIKSGSNDRNYNAIVDKNLKYDEGGAASYIKEMIEKGEYTLCRKNTAAEIANSEDDLTHKYTTFAASASFAEVYYTADDAAAEAEYNSITKKLETMEKKLDMQMEQIETERSAIKTEKESVEKVVKENVESTFKTFG